MDMLQQPGKARDAMIDRLREEGDRVAAEMVQATTGSHDHRVGAAVVEPEALPVVERTPPAEPAPVATFVDLPPVATVRLDFPLALDGAEPIEILRIWPPTFAEVQQAVDGVATELEMHATMMRVPAALLRSLRWSDAERVTSIARIIAPEMRSA